MPNLVGIGNSQVPTNAMLGGLAYQDPTDVNIESLEPGNISKISKELIPSSSSPNVKGVFVYNTSHDTDGGQWRHNCQNTSWYSEPLGTDVRGTTRKFPKIAVCILFENNSGTEGVTDDMIIYDADKPDMPMWMKVRYKLGSGVNTQVRALNGKIVMGASNNGILIIDFANDTLTNHNHAHKHMHQGVYPCRLGRTQYGLAHTAETGFEIRGEYTLDFDVTVTPDSQINPNTGLHEITIAGSTSGSGGGGEGWWIIFDDGTVSNIGTSGGSSGYGRHGSNCAFILGGNFLFAGKNTYASGQRNSNIYQIQQKFGNENGTGLWTTHNNAFVDLVDSSSWNDRSNQIDFFGNFAGEIYGKGTCAIDDRVFATSLSTNASSLVRYYIRMNDIRYSMVCINRYQHGEQRFSGWMPGRAYNASLSSTTPDSDSNGTIGFVENPGFKNRTYAPWFGDSGASLTWQEGGSVLVTNGGGDNSYAIRQNDCFTSGRKYKITGTIVPTFSGSYTFRVRAGGSGVQWSVTSGLTSGQTYNFNTGTITADGSPLEIGSAGGTMTQFVIENIRVYDQNDLDVGQYMLMWNITGTIKKERVAPNADLVAYHNFSNGDYLYINPINIVPGTGDFYVMFWCKSPPSQGGTYFHAWSQGSSSTGGQSSGTGWVIKTYSTSSGLQWYPYSGNGSGNQGIDNNLCIQPYNSWNCIVVGRDNGKWKLYMDGELRDDGNTNSSNFSDQYVTIGTGLSQTNENIPGIKLALMRFGAGKMPDSAMIKYMYHQEAPLFRENAKCTLVGTDNQNLKMDFDPDTKLLHVGSTSGRSDFNGLQRINSTTNPVEIALSASGGIIAEA